jgi:hypothetical protein
MAIGTAGTTTTTGLTALFVPGSFISPAGVVQSFVESDADVATINNAMRDDLYAGVGNAQGSQLPYQTPMMGWSRNGQLYIPNRGWLKVMPGDMIGVDANGWPILVSAKSIATGGWTKTAT